MTRDCIADLTNESERAYEAARQFAEQLGVANERCESVEHTSLASVVGALVDFEANGSRVVRIAHRWAERLAAAAPNARFVFIVPPSRALDPEDSWLFRFLGRTNTVVVWPSFSPREIAKRGWAEFLDGGDSAGLRLLERAASLAEGEERQSFLAALQGARLACHRFEDAAEITVPLDESRYRAFLLQTKGWALAMLRRNGEAEPYLAAARTLTREHSAQRSYLLNISALNRLRLGDIEGAMELETVLEVALQSEHERDWQLEYLNALNRARLALRRNAYDEAARLYAEAFATTDGVRSTDDHIHRNIVFARLHAARGDSRAALAAWIRASLHWLAASIPEALSLRVARTLLRRENVAQESVRAAVDAALLDELQRACPVNASNEPLEITSDARAAQCAIGADGWSVLVAHPTHTRPPHLLAATLRAVLATQVPPLAHTKCWIVDDRFGDEIASTAAELAETASRRAIPHITFNGTPLIAAPRRIVLSPAVDHLTLGTPARVTYRRYLPSRALDAEETSLVTELLLRGYVLESEVDRELVRRLEEGRVVKGMSGAGDELSA